MEKAITDNAGQQQTLSINREIRDGLNAAYRQLRELLTTFRLGFKETGLHTALEDTVQEFQKRSDIDIVLTDNTANCRFSANAEIHLIHIIREALSNILQHSRASEASVVLQCNQEGLATLLIEDNGMGIQDISDKPHHYGLSIMKERSRSLNGNLEIGPSGSGGTVVKLTFSIQT